jgi:hypothetical protein
MKPEYVHKELACKIVQDIPYIYNILKIFTDPITVTAAAFTTITLTHIMNNGPKGKH